MGRAVSLVGAASALALFAAASLEAQVSITIASSPAGASFTVNGAGCSPGAYTTPQSLSWTTGTSCTVGFASPQYPQAGTQYGFTGWQDGGTSNPRVIPALALATTYTANFSTSYFLTTIANPSQGGTVSGGGWYAANSTATVTATPASGYQFLSWTGVTNTTAGSTSATVNMTAGQYVTANFTPTLVPPNNYVATQILASGTGVAINNFGQVVAYNPSNPARASLWTPATANGTVGSLTDLGSLPVNGTPSIVPSGIDDQGQIVGTVAVLPANTTTEAFLWQPSAPNATTGSMMTFLGPGTSPSTAIGINGFGQIIGVENNGSYIWTPSSANATVGTLNTDSRLNGVTAINGYGQAVINSCVQDFPGYNVWEPSLFTPSAPNGNQGSYTQAGLSGGANLIGTATAINSNGTVTGKANVVCSGLGSPFHDGFIWTPASANGTTGTNTEITAPAGFDPLIPLALNSSGQVVGQMYRSSDGHSAPFLYAGGTVYDLSSPGGQPSEGSAVGINDKGQILINANGGVYLLTKLQSPAPATASPASGNGSSQTFVFTFTDPRGWQDLDVVNVLINNFIDGRSACYLAYSVPSSTLYLVNDAGLAGGPYAGSVALGNSATLQNSQCMVSLTSANGNGNTLTLTVNATFKTAFGGNKILYEAARDLEQNNSGWVPMGVWQAPGATQPTTTAVVGMNPASGAGFGPTAYNFSFSDTKGFQDLGVANILVNGALDGRHACYLAYARSINVLYLVNDTGDGLLPGQSLNIGGNLSNSQCAVSWGSNAVAANGNTLSLSLNIGFTPGFGPNLVFYLAARDVNEANNTDWQAKATWSVQ